MTIPDGRTQGCYTASAAAPAVNGDASVGQVFVYLFICLFVCLFLHLLLLVMVVLWLMLFLMLLLFLLLLLQLGVLVLYEGREKNRS